METANPTLVAPAVTVYSKPACVQCTATYRALSKKGIPFEVVDVTADPDALGMLKGLGYFQAPVVVTADGAHWAGFRPDLIGELPAPGLTA